jgi:hypothetical protein
MNERRPASRPDNSDVPPIAYTIHTITEMSGLSRATIFRELKAGRLKAKKVGARTLVLAVDWQTYLSSLPPRAA